MACTWTANNLNSNWLYQCIMWHTKYDLLVCQFAKIDNFYKKGTELVIGHSNPSTGARIRCNIWSHYSWKRRFRNHSRRSHSKMRNFLCNQCIDKGCFSMYCIVLSKSYINIIIAIFAIQLFIMIYMFQLGKPRFKCIDSNKMMWIDHWCRKYNC